VGSRGGDSQLVGNSGQLPSRLLVNLNRGLVPDSGVKSVSVVEDLDVFVKGRTGVAQALPAGSLVVGQSLQRGGCLCTT
jgi:hypothetical protein